MLWSRGANMKQNKIVDCSIDSNKEIIQGSLSWVDSLRTCLSYLLYLLFLTPNRDIRASHKMYIRSMNHSIVSDLVCLISFVGREDEGDVSVSCKELLSLQTPRGSQKNFCLVGNQYAKPDSDTSKMRATCAD